MPKERLPTDIEQKIPSAVLHIIYSYLSPIQKSPKLPLSQTATNELTLIRNSPKLKGKSEMFLYGLDELI
jgi:hypothetical protein